MEKLILYLDEWFTTEIEKVIPREKINLDFPESMGIAISGIRRCGKTYLLFEIAKNLRTFLPKNNIVYINFEDDRLLPLTGEELKVLVSVLKQNFEIDNTKPLWFLLDEIQTVPNWEKFIRSFIDRKIARIIITGSSRNLTGKEISSKLAGRIISKTIFPLSFKEFLKFKNFTLDLRELKYSKHNEVMHLFLEYIEYGGFPEVVLSENKKEILSNYFNTIFYRDMVEKFSIRKIEEFENFIRLIIRNSGTLFSTKKTVDFMKSIGFKLSKNTALEYIGFADSAFLLYPVEIFSYKLKDRLQYPKKMYCADNGFMNLIKFKTKRDYGNLLENVVLIELLRRNKKVFYWKSYRGEEVDFVILGEDLKPLKLIQVCWDIGDEETEKREIKSLLKAMEEFKLKKSLVITRDFSLKKKINNKKIIYKPFWLWTMEENEI